MDWLGLNLSRNVACAILLRVLVVAPGAAVGDVGRKIGRKC